MRVVCALIALLVSMSTRAEVLTVFDTPVGAVPPVPKDAAVWVKCFGCKSLKGKLIQALTENGYTVVSNSSDATIKVVVAAGVSVPEGGKAPRLYADDVYGKGIQPISPAIKSDIRDVSLPSVRHGILNIDAGATNEGMKLTGSRGGGILVALGVSALTRLIHQKQADAVRTPGVVEMGVTIYEDKTKKGFDVIAAANTPETPDALLDAAVSAAVQGLINGVQDVKTPIKDEGNAQ